jgi:hypothetical protein
MSAFSDKLLARLREESKGHDSFSSIDRVIKKFIPDKSFRYQCHWKTSYELAGVIPDDYYSALLLEGIRVPISLERDSLVVIDGDVAYEWQRKLIAYDYKKVGHQSFRQYYIVKDTDRLKFPSSKVRKEYLEKVNELL